jgi:hypothetical protein
LYRLFVRATKEASAMSGIGKARLPWICGLMLLALSACDGSSPTAPKPGHLSLSVGLSSTHLTAGQPLTLTFTVLNDGGEPVELVFGDSCRFDLSVASGQAVVWNALAKYACLQQVTRSSLRPGEAFVFENIWDQSRNSGGWVGPGTYSVVGTLRASGRPLSPAATLIIR